MSAGSTRRAHRNWRRNERCLQAYLHRCVICFGEDRTSPCPSSLLPCCRQFCHEHCLLTTHMTASLPSPTHIPSCFSISHTLLAMAWFTVSTSLTAPYSPRVKVIACFSILFFLPRPRVGQPFGVRTPRFLVISHYVPFPLYSFSFVQFTSQRSDSLFRCQRGYYAPVRARWELTQTPSFMFGLFFEIFCFFFVFVFPYFRAHGVA